MTAVAQPAGLLSVLKDSTASPSERDDAAMDLGDFDVALPVLVAVAHELNTPDVVVNSCGTSIGEIWKRTGGFDQPTFDSLPKTARDEIVGLLSILAV
ncbi:MAG: hypothetical protein ACK4M2_11800 [Brevundimonas sp.]